MINLRSLSKRPFKKLLAPLLDQRPASRLIRTTAREQWKLIGLNLATSIIQALGEGVTFGVIFLAVDLLSRPAGAGIAWTNHAMISWIPGLTQFLNGVPRPALFLLMLFLAVVLRAIQSISEYFNAVSAGYFSARCKTKVSSFIHHQILSLTFPCAGSYRVGDLTYYASAGPGSVQTVIQACASLALNALLITCYLTVLLALSPWLLIAVVAMGGMITLLQKNLLPRIRASSFRLTSVAMEIGSRMTEDIQALRLLHSSGQLDAADHALSQRMGEMEHALRHQSRLGAVISPLTNFLPIMAIALIAGLSLLVFGSRGTGVLPSLVTFVLALQRLNAQFAGVAGNFTSLNNNAGNLDRLNQILDPRDKQYRRRGGRPFEKLRRQIELVDVSLRYSQDLPYALRNINLTILRGQTVALVGASGAGKSSIADLLVGLYTPTEGRILIDGLDISQIELGSWQRCLGVVSQDTFLFNATIGENIAFGTDSATPEMVASAAAMAQADGFIEKMPESYETIVGERGYRLSGGQRQRISLARAILRTPELLLLDEATSALDSHSERLVQQAIEQFENQHTVLVIAHRLSTIVNADQICVIDAGSIVERGTHQDLLSLGGVYANLWAQQTRHSQRQSTLGSTISK